MSVAARYATRRSRRAVAVASGCYAAAVAAVTTAAHVGAVDPTGLIASPARVARGSVWLLVSNGLLVQRPVVLSLVAFVLLTVYTLAACGGRVLAAAAVVGHVGSTLLAYSIAASAYLVDHAGWRGLLQQPDYGVSAIQAAWIGALAATAWRREGQTRRGRGFVVAACAGIAAFAAWLRHDITLLDLDHLFAFVFGVGFARAWGVRGTRPLLEVAASLLRSAATAAASACAIPARRRSTRALRC